MSSTSALQECYLSGKSACILIIPKEIARIYKIDNPSQVTIEETHQGIIIKNKLAGDQTKPADADRHTNTKHLDMEQVYNNGTARPQQ
jgi:hypothetical protein